MWGGGKRLSVRLDAVCCQLIETGKTMPECKNVNITAATDINRKNVQTRLLLAMLSFLATLSVAVIAMILERVPAASLGCRRH